MVNYPTFDNNRFQSEVPVEYYLGLARNEYTPTRQPRHQRHISTWLNFQIGAGRRQLYRKA